MPLLFFYPEPAVPEQRSVFFAGYHLHRPLSASVAWTCQAQLRAAEGNTTVRHFPIPITPALSWPQARTGSGIVRVVLKYSRIRRV